MESKRRRPTEAELAILRVLWEGNAQSVRAIQQVLNESRPTGYTTVLKLMQIMTEKGLVERDETCRPRLYRARYTRQQTQRQLLGDLMNRAFGGSVKAMVLQALAIKKSSPEELEAMETSATPTDPPWFRTCAAQTDTPLRRLPRPLTSSCVRRLLQLGMPSDLLPVRRGEHAKQLDSMQGRGLSWFR
jgi:predicted transcriptional regulator